MKPLDSKAVDRIFARMTVRYGSAWTARWQGLPIDAVKADWADELAGARYEAIVYALGYLPTDYPPTATQFRDICRRAPSVHPPRLDAPPTDPKRVAEIVSRIAAPPMRHSRAWAHRLRDRELAGDKLSAGQRAMWRAALHVEHASAVIDAACDSAPVLRDMVTADLVSEAA